MSPADWQALVITLRLAVTTAVLLLVIATPLAWWLAQSRRPFARIVEAVVALPLVLPPTVLGFYLLLLLSPAQGPGAWWFMQTGFSLAFSYPGLVIASVVYALPFCVQPLQQAFEGLDNALLDVAATLHASPIDRFFSLVMPLARRGYLTAAVLTFAHTMGEFGVLLMVGGNIAGETRVASIAIFEHVEAGRYADAHGLAIVLLGVAFSVVLLVYLSNQRLQVQR